jgi:hypothetical protein
MIEKELIKRYAYWLDLHHLDATIDDQGNKVLEEISELQDEMVQLHVGEGSSLRTISEAADVIFATMGLIHKLGYDIEIILDSKMMSLEARSSRFSLNSGIQQVMHFPDEDCP